MGTFLWGVATAHFHWWPYGVFQDIYDKPTPEGYLSPHQARMTLFEAFQPDVDIVFLGDSLVQQASWQDMFPEYKIANRGISDEDFSHMVSRLDNIIALKPELVILSGGINNAGRYDVRETILQYKAIVQSLESNGVTVVLISTPYCNCGGQKFVTSILPEMEAFARSNKNTWVELNSELSENGKLKSEYTYDGVHMTGLGYKKWQEQINPVLKAFFR